MFRWWWILIVGLAVCTLPAQAQWVVKNGWIDYCNHQIAGDSTQYLYDGMPDFCQRQDNWKNSLNPPQWTWCGVVATANCLWWFDSKFEMVKCKSLPPGTQVRPPTISDHYPLVYNVGTTARDDHVPANVVPWITALGGAFGAIPANGMTGRQLKTMIENWLALPQVNLWGHYVVTIKSQPSFAWIAAQVDSSQNQIALLGFWQLHTSGQWVRFGGHWLTVAGADKTPGAQQISFSDPCVDNAETGFPGAIWDGWLIAHVHGPHAVTVHNDAGNVSHDYYSVGGSPSPGGIISPNGYGDYWPDSLWENFVGLNPNDSLTGVTGDFDPSLPVHTELEEILMVCPNFDYGDLGEDYPTIDVESCGPAHPLTDKAWLGQVVTSEVKPRIYNHDDSDDGVTFLHLPWSVAQSCTVFVGVTTGAHYAGETLYLTAWIDGNNDGDFDDGPAANEDDSLNYSEWVIQDFAVPAGNASYQFVFHKPGVGTGLRPTIMRFRLNSVAAGRFGYGGYWGGGVSNGWGTYDIDWTLGEVEDYSFPVAIPNPIHDLVIKLVSTVDPIILGWTCPEEGMYYIYSTSNKNNQGDPRHETGWTLELSPMYFLPGPVTVTLPPMSASDQYKNYVIVYETP
jgi:hypothetical protein